MSHSSQESKIVQYREALAQANSEFILLVKERRALSLKIQELKGESGLFAHFDPEREKQIFLDQEEQFRNLTLKELLSFSILMEDQATAMAPGSYPSWLTGIHIEDFSHEIYQMVNPILLSVTHKELFKRLKFSAEFAFLKDF